MEILKLMTCPDYSELLGEYALGKAAELVPVEVARIEAHLAECPACRRALAMAKSAERVLGAAGQSGRKPKIANWLLVSGGLVAAVLLLVLSYLGRATPQSPAVIPVADPGAPADITTAKGNDNPDPREIDPVQAVQVSKEPTSPEPDSAAALTKTHLAKNFDHYIKKMQNLTALQKRLAAGGPFDSDLLSREIQEAAQEIADEFAGSNLGIRAHLLIYKSMEKRSELEEAKDKFREYIAMVDKQRGAKEASRAVFLRGHQKFREKDYVESIYYLSYAVEMYPNEKAGLEAQMRLALAYKALKYPDKAMEIYKKLANDHPENILTAVALTRLADIQARSGDFAAAEATCRLVSDSFANHENKEGEMHAAFAINFLGGLKTRQNQLVEAIVIFKELQTKYPTSLYAKQAHIKISRLNAQIIYEAEVKTNPQ